MYALVESPVDTEVLQASQTTVRVLPDSVMLGILLSHDMLYTIAPVTTPVVVGAGMSVPPIVYVAPLAMDDNDLATCHVMDALGPGPGPGPGLGPGPDTVL